MAPEVKYKGLAERRMRVFESMDVSMDANPEVKNPSVRARFLHNRHILLLHDDPGSYRNRAVSRACDAYA